MTKPLSDDPRFRWLDSLENDLKQPDLLPPVVFIEPDYTDIALGHSAPPNDDHPPSSIDFGQKFLARVPSVECQSGDLVEVRDPHHL